MSNDQATYEQGAQDSTSSQPASEARSEGSPTPSGEVGRDTAACRCGAGPHPDDPNRCSMGHMIQGNDAAVVAGERSAAFWREHETARRELREAILADAGHDPDDAPQALAAAADSLAMAQLVQQSAYLRMLEQGGPLSASGRARRCFDVWVKATDRVERYARLVGLERKARQAESLEEIMSR